MSDKKHMARWAIGVVFAAFLIDIIFKKKSTAAPSSSSGYTNLSGSTPNLGLSSRVKFGANRGSGCSGTGICEMNGGAGSIPVGIQNVGQTLMMTFSLNALLNSQPYQRDFFSKTGGLYVFNAPYKMVDSVFMAAGVPVGAITNGGTYTVAGDVVRLQLSYSATPSMGARMNSQQVHNTAK